MTSNTTRPPRGTLLAIAHDLAARPDGLTADQYAAATHYTTRQACVRLHTASTRPGTKLFAASGVSPARYFSTPDAAATWAGNARRTGGAKTAQVLTKKIGPPALTNYTAGPSKAAPALRHEPIITSDTKVTIDDRVRPTARWQAQPSQPAPGFSTLGIGRYL